MPAYHTSSHSGLMAVDPVEANAFRVVVAEDFEGVAFKHWYSLITRTKQPLLTNHSRYQEE
jgi:hypothetical protein